MPVSVTFILGLVLHNNLVKPLTKGLVEPVSRIECSVKGFIFVVLFFNYFFAV